MTNDKGVGSHLFSLESQKRKRRRTHGNLAAGDDSSTKTKEKTL